MLFNSFAFVLFFVLILALYWVIPSRMKTYFLLMASYSFYAFWDWRFLSLIIAISIINFYFTIIMDDSTGRRRRQWLAVIVFLNLIALATFKYLNFFLEAFSSLVGNFGFEPNFTTMNIILPLGISFITFKAISYAVDVYKQEMKPTASIIEFGIFLSYFPYMIAGPIMSAKTMIPQFRVFPSK